MSNNINSNSKPSINIPPNPLLYVEEDPEDLEAKLKNKNKTAIFFAQNGINYFIFFNKFLKN